MVEKKCLAVFLIYFFLISVPRECDPNPCQNGGTCVEVGDTYECTCLQGYTGTNCDTGKENQFI